MRQRPEAGRRGRLQPPAPADGWDDVTAAEFLDEVSGVAKGLIAAGVEAGDRVALISKTRYEWTLVDYAIWFAGAVTVPIYETSSAEQIGWILQRLRRPRGRRRGPRHLARIARSAATSTELNHVWSIDDNAVDVLTRLGADITDDGARERRTTATPLDLATLIYTSGTTGRPKGCMLTHGNFMFELGVAVDELDELFAARGRLDPAVPAAGPRVRPDHPGRLREGPRPAGPQRRHQEPGRRPRRVPADVHPRRPARLREGLQHRLAEATADGAAGSSTRPPRPRSPTRAASTRPAPPLRLRAQHAVFSGWSTASCAPRSAATAVRRLRRRARSATGSATSTAASG